MPAAESAITIVIAAAVGMFAAATAAVLPEPPPDAVIGIMDSRLRLICIAGSLGGAVLSVGLFKFGCVRVMARKFICSSLAGVLFAPMSLRWLGWTHDIDAVLAVSGLTALMSWTVLQMAVPALTRAAAKRIEGAQP